MSPHSVFYYYNKERPYNLTERFEISIKPPKSVRESYLLFSNRLALYNTGITKGLQLSKRLEALLKIMVIHLK